MTTGRTELLQRRSWRRSESSVAARPIAASFFVGLVLVIALARLGGIAGSIVLGWPQQPVLRCFSLFESDSVTSGLAAAILFAVLRGTVLEVGPGEPPSSGGGLTVLTTEPVQRMVRRETPIASLEQALSGGKARRFGLPADCRATILKLGQGERELPAGQVSPLERQLHGEAILEVTGPPGGSQRRPTKIIQDRQETANNTRQPPPAKPPNWLNPKPPPT